MEVINKMNNLGIQKRVDKMVGWMVKAATMKRIGILILVLICTILFVVSALV